MNKSFLFLLFFAALTATVIILSNKFDPPYTADETKVIAPKSIQDTLFLDTTYKLAKKSLPKRDALVVNRPSRYTYTYYNNQDPDAMVSNPAKPIMITKRMPKIKTIAPIFDKECLTAINPMDCSQRELDQYFKQKLIDQGYSDTFQDTLTTSFMIDEYGAVNGPITVEGNSDCKDCKRIIIKAISGMQNWTAALKDNQPVKVRVILPMTI